MGRSCGACAGGSWRTGTMPGRIQATFLVLVRRAAAGSRDSARAVAASRGRNDGTERHSRQPSAMRESRGQRRRVSVATKRLVTTRPRCGIHGDAERDRVAVVLCHLQGLSRREKRRSGLAVRREHFRRGCIEPSRDFARAR